MPLMAVALEAYLKYRQIRRHIDLVLQSERIAKAKIALEEAHKMITGGQGRPSSPGHPFKSQRGFTKAMLGLIVAEKSATIGFVHPVKGRTAANIMEKGSRHVRPRPVLQLAIKAAARHPWKTMLKTVGEAGVAEAKSYVLGKVEGKLGVPLTREGLEDKLIEGAANKIRKRAADQRVKKAAKGEAQIDF